MPKRKARKKTEYEMRVLRIIKVASDYKNGEGKGQYPERRKIAELTGIGLISVQGIIKSIQDETGILYARNLTHSERGKRARQAAKGEDYDIY